jgi:hypothetical protein
MDLFGETITTPQVKVKRESNSMEGFAEFWQAWPSGPRKVAKQQCVNKWAKYDCADTWRHIVAHVEWMKTQADWIKDKGSFIPQPLTYLNQQRWIDWEPPKPREAPKVVKQAADNPAPMPEHVREMLAKMRRKVA